MPTTPVRDRLAAIEQLSRFFSDGQVPSWVPRATFNAIETLRVGRTVITAAYSVNVLPPGMGRDGVYRSLVTLSPHRARRVARGSGWDPALLKLGWYRQCDVQLKGFGYRGTWLGTEWGRVGYFTKRHGGARSLEREVAILEEIRAGHRALWKSRRTTRSLGRIDRSKGPRR